MSKPRKLCSTCLDTLQSGLEDVLECEKTLHRSQKHHTTFKDFQEAASQDCFMCTKLWNSIRSDVLASWESELKNWQPLECSLSRRPWAAERYGAFYWHVVYVSLFSEELDLLDFDYQGNTFCLLKNEDGTLTHFGLMDVFHKLITHATSGREEKPQKPGGQLREQHIFISCP